VESLGVLLLGGGGRESALALTLSRSPHCRALLVAPGNAGLARSVRCLPRLDPLDVEAVAGLVRQEGLDLVLVGPEQPLVAGLVDGLEQRGIRVFGPTRAAAALEGSKAWAKEFMLRHRIPTAAHRIFTSLSEAEAFLDQAPWPVVLKADGLAAGKGVVLPEHAAEARATARAMLVEGAFGAAGSTLVVEERMCGPELSVFALCDGESAWILGSARDHKRVGEGDTGPNTGGMGALAPSPLATPEHLARVRREILDPVLAGMRAEGRPYRGILYLGLMWTDRGPRVIEFNCRLGDPETQALLPLLQVDLLEAAWTVARGLPLPAEPVPMLAPGACVCVVLAAEGYPGPVRSGDPILGVPEAEAGGAAVFHAGVKAGGSGDLLTAGGRVLGLSARGATAQEARERAMAAAGRVSWPGLHYRKDIGA
jgi:phosphoribosylamine--glycine ligase